MESTTSTYFIALRGNANISECLEIGKNYRIVSEGSITEKKEVDNFDGTKNTTFRFEPVVIEIKDELGTTIRARDPRKNSQKIRSFLFKIYSDEGYTEDFDSFYDAATQEILSTMPAIARQAHKRLQ